ncbi:UDP-3-O-(3-hydroxymyristoyl)glucosamine N-acyltransferase [Thiopseudomonas alkaliphila]|uniref:UDP-3-O-(3-hydroxymyristoyl)glucosamine N-acyltransferase n=1 Tax=Thiopseudomonas alkaliphila TaxID=1697053 RepID=UPI002577895B|nr:UDP-3-O-(3-hydroxymyristoyl)glucosamine N-acyltransferase [Thiopseudomonas alkaliphila]MDM1715525.1 UDP-3-O-(3-hydroxymyristoyl)glucosamine N-acyltransferase [Thiopseudomonas alkaliphila]
MKKKQITLAELAEFLQAKLQANPEATVSGLAALDHAQPDQLSFLSSSKYRKSLDSTQAGCVLLTADDAEGYSGPCLIVADPYLAYAKVSHWFDDKPVALTGIHPSAVVDATAQVHPEAKISAHAVIEACAVIGAGSYIGAGTVIGAHSVVGADCWIAPNVTIYHRVSMGDRVSIQSGAVIGGEGFGFANHQGQWHKIAQIGGVSIGHDVEIGANTTIDRGAIEDTVIGNGVKLDNQIQIAHNVQIGDHTAMAACVGISGSAKIGKHCMLAGGVGLVGHIEICDGVFISGMTMVTHSITEPGAYSSGTAMQPAKEWKKNAVRFRQLDDFAKRLRALEKKQADT